MDVVVVFVDVVEAEDIRAAGDKVEDLGLRVDAAAVGGVGERVLVDGFAGEGIVGGGREAAVDDAESAATELFAQLVVLFQAVAHDIFAVGFCVVREFCEVWGLFIERERESETEKGSN